MSITHARTSLPTEHFVYQTFTPPIYSTIADVYRSGLIKNTPNLLMGKDALLRKSDAPSAKLVNANVASAKNSMPESTGPNASRLQASSSDQQFSSVHSSSTAAEHRPDDLRRDERSIKAIARIRDATDQKQLLGQLVFDQVTDYRFLKKKLFFK